jgi:O-antigen ligase
MTGPSVGDAPKKQSLFALLNSLPTLIRTLVKQEIELVKAELIAKLKVLGVGAGLIAIAAVITLLLLGVLLTWAFLGLAAVLPLWAAGLIMSVSLVVIIVVLVWIGVTRIRTVETLLPERSLDSLRSDADVITGTAKGTGR